MIPEIVKRAEEVAQLVKGSHETVDLYLTRPEGFELLDYLAEQYGCGNHPNWKKDIVEARQSNNPFGMLGNFQLCGMGFVELQ